MAVRVPERGALSLMAFSLLETGGPPRGDVGDPGLDARSEESPGPLSCDELWLLIDGGRYDQAETAARETRGPIPSGIARFGKVTCMVSWLSG